MSLPGWLCALLTPEWLTAIGTVGATVVALGLGLKDWLRDIFIHPKLIVDAGVAPPNAQKTLWMDKNGSNGGEVWYFRLSILNAGKAVANDAFVFLAGVEKLNDAQQFETVPRFTPMFLKWSNVGQAIVPKLWPGIPRFCDLGHLTNPQNKNAMSPREDLPGMAHHYSVLALDLEVTPNQHGNLLGYGTYRLRLRYGATNCAPKTLTLRVEFSGLWYQDQGAMFDAFKMIVFD